MTTINPAFITLAQNYLATKERTPHYEIRSISDCCPADGWCNLQSFSDEEMAQLLALREKYGNEDFFNHLDEVFDEDTLHDMIYGSEAISFDLDNEYYMYSFTYHQITPKGVDTGTVKINLMDETYIRLLTHHLEDKDMNINSLRYADRDLYDVVMRGIDGNFCYDDLYMVRYPYTITMDEALADAQKIREQHPGKFENDHGMAGYFIY
jgi:hypothetical protein